VAPADAGLRAEPGGYARRARPVRQAEYVGRRPDTQEQRVAHVQVVGGRVRPRRQHVARGARLLLALDACWRRGLGVCPGLAAAHGARGTRGRHAVTAGRPGQGSKRRRARSSQAAGGAGSGGGPRLPCRGRGRCRGRGAGSRSRSPGAGRSRTRLPPPGRRTAGPPCPQPRGAQARQGSTAGRPLWAARTRRPRPCCVAGTGPCWPCGGASITNRGSRLGSKGRQSYVGSGSVLLPVSAVYTPSASPHKCRCARRHRTGGASEHPWGRTRRSTGDSSCRSRPTPQNRARLRPQADVRKRPSWEGLMVHRV